MYLEIGIGFFGLGGIWNRCAHFQSAFLTSSYSNFGVLEGKEKSENSRLPLVEIVLALFRLLRFRLEFALAWSSLT